MITVEGVFSCLAGIVGLKKKFVTGVSVERDLQRSSGTSCFVGFQDVKYEGKRTMAEYIIFLTGYP